MRSLPNPATIHALLPSLGYPGQRVVTRHHFSRREKKITGAGEVWALIYVCNETNIPRQWGFEAIDPWR